MNTEMIPLLVGFFVVYAWTLFLGASDIRMLNKENAKLRLELSGAMQRIAIKNAAEEGNPETARLMAAVHRDMVQTKPPLSAGAKKEAPQTGIKVVDTS